MNGERLLQAFAGKIYANNYAHTTKYTTVILWKQKIRRNWHTSFAIGDIVVKYIHQQLSHDTTYAEALHLKMMMNFSETT